MRGAPQSGFARLIFRMRSRTSGATSGLPGLPGRLFQVQYRRNPRRCQATTVSGLTMMRAERQPDHRRSSHPQKRRSTSVSRTRPRCDLQSTFIWWRRARISNCKAARVWKQERRVPRNESNRVNIGVGSLAAGANQHQWFLSERSFWYAKRTWRARGRTSAEGRFAPNRRLGREGDFSFRIRAQRYRSPKITSEALLSIGICSRKTCSLVAALRVSLAQTTLRR